MIRSGKRERERGEERILYVNEMGQEQYPSSCCDGDDTGQSFQTCQPILFYGYKIKLNKIFFHDHQPLIMINPSTV